MRKKSKREKRESRRHEETTVHRREKQEEQGQLSQKNITKKGNLFKTNKKSVKKRSTLQENTRRSKTTQGKGEREKEEFFKVKGETKKQITLNRLERVPCELTRPQRPQLKKAKVEKVGLLNGGIDVMGEREQEPNTVRKKGGHRGKGTSQENFYKKWPDES